VLEPPTGSTGIRRVRKSAIRAAIASTARLARSPWIRGLLVLVHDRLPLLALDAGIVEGPLQVGVGDEPQTQRDRQEQRHHEEHARLDVR